ncbi:MAG: pilin [Prevotella sp.]|nr:pilin [Prevotella sp.]
MGMTLQLLYDGADFKSDLGTILVTIVGAVGALMTLYACYIGYLFATATDENKRRAAKNRLLKVISSVLLIFALTAALSMIKVQFGEVKVSDDGTTPNLGDSSDWSSASYTYDDTPALTLSRSSGSTSVTGSFTVDINNVKLVKDDVKSDVSGIEWTGDMTFIDPSSFPGTPTESNPVIRINTTKTKSNNIITNATFTYQYDDSQMQPKEPCNAFTFLTDESLPLYVTCAVSFKNVKGNDPAKSVLVKVQVKLSGNINGNTVAA